MTAIDAFTPLPDHTQLPCEDGTFVKNFQEHPQSILLTESIRPVLDRVHPEGDYCIGQDSGIYWRLTDPPQRGAEAPDWFYVGNVPPTLAGQARRSYVLWQEIIPPHIVIEFVSGTGAEERVGVASPWEDRTPWTGKFWVYETAIRPAYYAIYEVKKSAVEVYVLQKNKYQLLPANERGHFPIEELGVELGIWPGVYQAMNLPWLRWWDQEGNLLLHGEEQAAQARQQADLERQRADLEHQRAEQATQHAEQERQRAEQAAQHAEQERQRAEQERAKAQKLRAKLAELGIDPDTVL